MSIPITTRTRQAALKISKQPALVVQFDGVDTLYGSSNINKLNRFGDEDLYFGKPGLTFGSFSSVVNQETLIDLDGSTNTVKQQLDIDKARGSSITSFELSLIDIGKKITRLISPGQVVTDMLGRKARIFLGFSENTSFPEDYVTIFRGIVDDLKAQQGNVKINIAHPDQKKKATIFASKETALDNQIDSSQTTGIVLQNMSDILIPVAGPTGAIDTAFEAHVLVDNEAIKFTGITSNGDGTGTLTGVTRGTLGTLAAGHDADASVASRYRLQGNVVDLALKVMLSGWQGYYREDEPIKNIGIRADGTLIPNSIYFAGLDVVEEYGVVVGDFVTIAGSGIGGNNVTMSDITDIQFTENGSYITISDALTLEVDSPATVSFRSQYDTLPDGLKMAPDEVDIAEHLKLRRLFLTSFTYDFRLHESIENAKEWIEQEIYRPIGAYSLPRKARASLGYFVTPIPGENTLLMNSSVITNPEKLSLRRTINKNFLNTVIYKFHLDLVSDKYLRGYITQRAESFTTIENVGTKALLIESDGLREEGFGTGAAGIVSNRRLNRFGLAAEFLEGIDVQFGYAFNLEIGDIVILDGSDLNIIDTATGTRGKPPKLFEVNNISKNFKTGKVSVDLIDTNFAGSQRYGLISPASRIKVGLSNTDFILEPAYNSRFGANEYQKWDRFVGAAVRIHSPDYSRDNTRVIELIAGNTIIVPALGFIPQPGDIMELAPYPYTPQNEAIKLIYAFIHDEPTFDDGEPVYRLI